MKDFLSSQFVLDVFYRLKFGRDPHLSWIIYNVKGSYVLVVSAFDRIPLLLIRSCNLFLLYLSLRRRYYPSSWLSSLWIMVSRTKWITLFALEVSLVGSVGVEKGLLMTRESKTHLLSILRLLPMWLRTNKLTIKIDWSFTVLESLVDHG